MAPAMALPMASVSVGIEMEAVDDARLRYRPGIEEMHATLGRDGTILLGEVARRCRRAREQIGVDGQAIENDGRADHEYLRRAAVPARGRTPGRVDQRADALGDLPRRYL